jgi:hypothetical protein
MKQSCARRPRLRVDGSLARRNTPMNLERLATLSALGSSGVMPPSTAAETATATFAVTLRAFCLRTQWKP